jgi:hypothetical protein
MFPSHFLEQPNKIPESDLVMKGEVAQDTELMTTGTIPSVSDCEDVFQQALAKNKR